MGGTNKSKRSSVKLTIGDITFDSKGIQKCINKHCPGVTPRQFARFHANDIFRIASKFGFVGSAWISITRLYSETLDSNNPDYINYQFWAAEFQVDNPSCPEPVRNALRQRFADRFSKKI
jgi:hypothetical protein